MSIPGSASPLFFTAAADAAAAGPIKSVRINSADNAKLTRTPSSAGNRKTWTWAGWVKLNNSSSNFFLGAGTTGTTNYTYARFGVYLDKIQFLTYGQFIFTSDAVFRDYSGWGHITLVCDTTESTAADRLKVYWNGVQLTNSATTTLDSNGEYAFNNTLPHTIGSESIFGTWDGYLADLYFIDGQALDPTSFGAFDDNGVWQAAAYSGTYGTNGYHLFDFANESGIGDDSSGNDNDFTVNNLIDDQITLPTWYTTTTLYTTSADVKANGTNRGQGAFTLSTAEFVYLIPEGGGTVGSVCHSSGSAYPSTFYTYVKDDDDSNWLYTGGFGTQETDDYVWDNTLTRDTFSFGAKKFSNKIDLYLIGDTRAGSPYQPTTDAKMSGSFPALINTDGATADADTDVLRDVPTNGDSSDDTGAGGEVSGNYCVFNALDTSWTLSNGNLDAVAPSSPNQSLCPGTIFVNSGKWYAEITLPNNSTSTRGMVGVHKLGADQDGILGKNSGDGAGYIPSHDTARVNGTETTSFFGQTYTSNNIIVGIALDLDDGTVDIYVNGTLAGELATGLSGYYTFAACDQYTTGAPNAVLNAGQRAFAYSAPSGYKALCTTNLPTPTIADGSDYFDTKLFTGTGAAQTITGLEFQPDFTWIKVRDNARSHFLFDAVRGATEYLLTDTTGAEVDDNTTLTAFTSDGFSVGASADVNRSTSAIVSWNWNAGSSTVSNTDGDMTSSVRVNQSAGFSIVKWTSPSGTTPFAVGHGLNAAPSFIITKRLTNTSGWYCYHEALDATNPQDKYLQLNTTDAVGTSADSWGTSKPDSTTFGDRHLNWAGGDDIIAYCFSPVSQYSAFGSYVGNGSTTNGAFVYTGFRPAWVMVKRVAQGSSYSSWAIYDSTRSTFNVTGLSSYNLPLWANLSAEEGKRGNGSDAASGSENIINFFSNGFMALGSGAELNVSGEVYIYIAFATSPFSSNGGLAF